MFKRFRIQIYIRHPASWIFSYRTRQLLHFKCVSPRQLELPNLRTELMSDPRVQVYLESLEIDVKAGHIPPAWFSIVFTCHSALFLHCFCPGDFCTVSFAFQRWLAQRCRASCQCFLWFWPCIILKMIDGRRDALRNDIGPAIAALRKPSCLSSGEGVISCDDFIEGILRCKGPARAIDQQLVQVQNLSL